MLGVQGRLSEEMCKQQPVEGIDSVIAVNPNDYGLFEKQASVAGAQRTRVVRG